MASAEERVTAALDCISARLTDAELAKRLYIGKGTVESHVANVIGKLDASNRREAVTIATRLGLI